MVEKRQKIILLKRTANVFRWRVVVHMTEKQGTIFEFGLITSVIFSDKDGWVSGQVIDKWGDGW